MVAPNRRRKWRWWVLGGMAGVFVLGWLSIPFANPTSFKFLPSGKRIRQLVLSKGPFARGAITEQYEFRKPLTDVISEASLEIKGQWTRGSFGGIDPAPKSWFTYSAALPEGEISIIERNPAAGPLRIGLLYRPIPDGTTGVITIRRRTTYLESFRLWVQGHWGRLRP